MGIIRYVHRRKGASSNDGTSWATAYNSIKQAFDEIDGMGSSASDSTVFIGTGVYNEGELYSTDYQAFDKCKFIGVGDVKIDIAGYSYFMRHYSSAKFEVFLINLKLYGWENYLFGNVGNNIYRYILLNCQIYQKGSKYLNDTYAAIRENDANYIKFLQCTLFGVLKSSQRRDKMFFRNCIMHNCGNGSSYLVDEESCAANMSYSSWTDGNGSFSSSTYPPPFKSDDTSDPNLDFDSSHAQFDKYMSGGWRGSQVGCASTLSISWHYGYNLGWSTDWDDREFNLDRDISITSSVPKNDVLYYDPSWEDIIISSSSNSKIDFEESSGSELTAQISDGTYSSGSSFALAVATALNNAGSNSYTVVFGTDTKRLSITSDGVHFSLLCSSGSSSDNAWSELGMDTSSDKTGSLTYASDNGLTKGGAVSGSAPAKWNSTLRGWEIDLDVEPNATSARFICGVIMFQEPKKLIHISAERYTEGNGEIDSDQTSTAREIEIRGQNSFFSEDSTSATTLDWTKYEFTPNGTTIDQTYRFWQPRITLRLNKSS